MLKRLFPPSPQTLEKAAPSGPVSVLLRKAEYPVPFPHALEYSAPCRGTWNIVHTGMLIPGTHQIFICASGCLRGVVLTAAEMGFMGRFSSIELHENDLTGRDNEMLIIEGVTDILARLPYRPHAILLFPACVHHFLGCNLRFVYQTLRKRFPDIAFAECFMDPIRQTRHLKPEERLRRAISRLLPELPKEKQVSIFGNNLKTDGDSDFVKLLQAGGFAIRDMSDCQSYDEFQKLGASRLNLYTNPFSVPAVQDMKKRLQQDFFYLPQTWDFTEIAALLKELAAKLGLPCPDFSHEQAKAEKTLQEARALIGSTPLALDLSFTFRPFGLAKLLCEHGFAVTKIYSDAVSPEEEEDFYWLKEHHGNIELWPTKAPLLRVLKRPAAPQDGKPALLALGQKAAYFNNTPYFVNLVESGGRWGFAAVQKLALDMMAAYQQPKDIEANVSRKGLGGPCIL
ncbi:MAG: nitrogenase component 1 [Mitsuokella sp.]|uniref:nitrogenase component 1 n=1 Tax=Mitsuokella sp. TaxID=2049034 RepID=UPI003EFDA0E3